MGVERRPERNVAGVWRRQPGDELHRIDVGVEGPQPAADPADQAGVSQPPEEMAGSGLGLPETDGGVAGRDEGTAHLAKTGKAGRGAHQTSPSR